MGDEDDEPRGPEGPVRVLVGVGVPVGLELPAPGVTIEVPEGVPVPLPPLVAGERVIVKVLDALVPLILVRVGDSVREGD